MRLRYRYDFEEMYDNDTVSDRLAAVQNDPEAFCAAGYSQCQHPSWPRGPVVRRGFHAAGEAMQRMQRLIEANQEVRQAFSNAAPAKGQGMKKS